MLGYFVALAVAGVVLLAIWYKSRSVAKNDAPDRGLAGEAATAIEDIAREMIERGSSRSGLGGDATGKDRTPL